MRTYVYADPHFSHANIIKYEARPFADVEEMNNTIIKNHNNVITEKDKVFILGDFALANKDKTIDLISQLKGYKILIIGNHDRRSLQFWRNAGFNEVSNHPVVINNFFILSHVPIKRDKLMCYINVHGHTHSHLLNSDRHINVSLDVIDFKPVLLEYLYLKNYKTSFEADFK